MKDERAVQEIADHYGASAQIVQAVEELSELTLELLNIRKHGENDDRRETLAEEIADVEIMLDQIKYLYGLKRHVEYYRTMKIARQINRITEESQ